MSIIRPAPEVPWFPHWQHQNVVWLSVDPRARPAPVETVQPGSAVPLMGGMGSQPMRRAVVASTLPATGGRRLGES